MAIGANWRPLIDSMCGNMCGVQKLRQILMTFILLGLLWTAGFVAFLTRLPSPSEPTTNSAVGAVDGVVVFTGGRGARISAGMSVFSSGVGERLLISGVNKSTSRERLAQLWPGAGEQFECCVDLGHAALTTQGNAREVSDWQTDHGYKTIMLVTSEFHMPRALAETHAAMPGAKIIPYTVDSGYLDGARHPHSPTAWSVLAREYTKYVAVQARAKLNWALQRG